MPGFFALRSLHHWLGGRESLDMALLRLFRPKGLFQLYADTADNRYPALFQLLRDRIGDGPDDRPVPGAEGDDGLYRKRDPAEEEAS